jgi:short-subunit dehydrogenase
MTHTPTIFIAAIASDIGRQLAQLYRQRGYEVIGTYRTEANLKELRQEKGISLLHCDVTDEHGLEKVAGAMRNLGKRWDVFIGAVGQLDPIGSFFSCDIREWANSVHANSIGQLSLLHTVYPFRHANGSAAKVAFLVGGGINGPFRNYSAYCLGKVLLVKFCELIDDEYPDVHAIAVGTGWVNTKIHKQSLDAAERSGGNYRRTIEFVTSGQPGTAITDILACIDWCFDAGKATTSGRNFSVVHDGWNTRSDELKAALGADDSMFKLRRRGA